MTTAKPLLRTPPTGAILLGRFAVWFGAAVMPIYLALFVLLLTRPPERPVEFIDLPPWLPEIGVFLSGLGWVLARLTRRRVPLACLAGLILNAIPLLMALVLPLLNGAG